MTASRILGELQTQLKKGQNKSTYKTAISYIDSKGRKRYTGHKVNLRKSGLLVRQVAAVRMYNVSMLSFFFLRVVMDFFHGVMVLLS